MYFALLNSIERTSAETFDTLSVNYGFHHKVNEKAKEYLVVEASLKMLTCLCSFRRI